jgi:hypothetical protein
MSEPWSASPAVALALVCLRNRDHTNFARIVASSPTVVVRELLNTKVLKLGKIFTDKNIWLLLSFAIPRYVEKGGGMARELEALTLATHNYLSFHQTTGAFPPVAQIRVRIESKYREHLFAHVNDPAALAASVENIWTFLCPKASPAILLRKFDKEAEIEAKIAACIINIFFSAVDHTLEEAASSKEKGARRLADAAGTAAGAVQMASNVSGAGVAGDAASGLLGSVTAQLTGAAVKHINEINVRSNFREQQFYYRTLYESLKENGRRERLVVAQPVFEDGNLMSFRASAPLGASKIGGGRSTDRRSLLAV